MPLALLKQVERTIERYRLLLPGEAVVVGVSGGPDSLSLLHVLVRLRERYNWRVHVAHLNHGARGAESDADAAFVSALADEWGVPVTVERRDVPALARKHHLAFEEAARRVRYAFLARVAGEVGAAKIAVGHNRDDQAETVLMHFLRGAGPAGLRGMLPLTPIGDYRLLEGLEPTGDALPSVAIVRPLLEVPRAAIERYCEAEGLKPRFDRSNLDTTYFRNRLRHGLLPLLETYNPNIRARLCHTAAVVAADYELLSQLRERAWERTVREEREGAVVFDLGKWRRLPVALQRSLLREAAYRLRRTLRDVDFVHVEQARRVGLEGTTGAQATLPLGLTLVVGYETLTVGEAGAEPPPDEPLLWGEGSLPVALPGETPIPGTCWLLRADEVTVGEWEAARERPDPWTAYCDRDALGDRRLALRTRRPGERFRPQGMGGHSVKLSDFMVNLKIPRRWRGHIPLLTADDEVVWVCGRRVSETVAVTGRTRRVARFRFVAD